MPEKAAGIVVHDTASVLFGVEGLQVIDAGPGPDGTLEVWAVTDYPAAAACPGCGMVSARRHDTVLARPRDVRRAGDQVAVWWVKCRWKCDEPGCGRKTFTEWLPQVPPRCRLTARLREQVGTEVSEILAAAAQAQRDASLAALRNPPPGQPALITNQMINALDAPAEAAHRELEAAEDAAAAVPARIRLSDIAPDMVRLEAEVKQITYAIRMAAYNAETTLARALDGLYARAGHEAYALIREALTASGDICPGNGQLLIRLDPLTAPRRTQALSALCDQLNQAQACYPGTDLVLRYEVKPHPGIA